MMLLEAAIPFSAGWPSIFTYAVSRTCQMPRKSGGPERKTPVYCYPLSRRHSLRYEPSLRERRPPGSSRKRVVIHGCSFNPHLLATVVFGIVLEASLSFETAVFK